MNKKKISWLLITIMGLTIPLLGTVPCLAAATDTLLIRTTKLPIATYVGNMPLTSRDPFNWPPVQVKRFAAQEKMATENPFAGLKLNGIVWNLKMPLAIINNRLLKKGDAINNVRVSDITRNKVTMKKSGRVYELKMEEKIINLNNGAGDQG